MQPDRFGVAHNWLGEAEFDLDTADLVQERHPNVACFHAQQAAEKALKAYLVAVCGDQPQSHVAEHLLSALRAVEIVPPLDVRDAAIALDRYYIPARYPDALGGASPSSVFQMQDAQAAMTQARSVVAWSRSGVHSERDSAPDSPSQ